MNDGVGTVVEVTPEPKGLLESWLGRQASFSRSLAFITILGALWRLGFLIFAKTDQRLGLNDSLYYSIQAGLNSDGQLVRGRPHRTAWGRTRDAHVALSDAVEHRSERWWCSVSGSR